MIAYGTRLIDIDLGIGRQYGYRDPANVDVTDTRTPPRIPARCHPDREHVAHGLCDCCYHASRKAARA